MKKTHKIVWISIAVIVLLIIIGYLVSQSRQSVPTTTESPTSTTTPATTTVADSGLMVLYTNNELGFSLEHPEESQITTKDENAGKDVSFVATLSKEELLVAVGTQDSFRGGPAKDACDMKAGTPVSINGVDFYTSDVSTEYSGASEGNNATEYCTVKNNTHYKLISLIPYSITGEVYSTTATSSPTIQKMIDSFTFTK